jgi:hypothetical protein
MPGIRLCMPVNRSTDIRAWATVPGMTDTPASPSSSPPDPPPSGLPNVSDNVRAEIARAGMTAGGTRVALRSLGVHISPTTWSDRMQDPGSWRQRELEAIASLVGVPTSTLVERRRPAGTTS